jgi:hypothetical protein
MRQFDPESADSVAAERSLDYQTPSPLTPTRRLPVSLAVCAASAFAASLAMTGLSVYGLGEPFYGAGLDDWVFVITLGVTAVLASATAVASWLWLAASLVRRRRLTPGRVASLLALLLVIVVLVVPLLPDVRSTLRQFRYEAGERFRYPQYYEPLF